MPNFKDPHPDTIACLPSNKSDPDNMQTGFTLRLVYIGAGVFKVKMATSLSYNESISYVIKLIQKDYFPYNRTLDSNFLVMLTKVR